MSRMFLDDIREPKQKYDIVVRSFEEAAVYILKHGMPNFISFDHDLGMDENGEIAKNGYDLAKWIVNMDLNGQIKIPRDFTFEVHSANPVGKENIETILNNYKNFKIKF